MPLLLKYHIVISANKSNQQPWNLIIAELAPPHAQSARESRGEMVWAAELTACCNYFSKKKKKLLQPKHDCLCYEPGEFHVRSNNWPKRCPTSFLLTFLFFEKNISFNLIVDIYKTKLFHWIYSTPFITWI